MKKEYRYWFRVDFIPTLLIIIYIIMQCMEFDPSYHFGDETPYDRLMNLALYFNKWVNKVDMFIYLIFCLTLFQTVVLNLVLCVTDDVDSPHEISTCGFYFILLQVLAGVLSFIIAISTKIYFASHIIFAIIFISHTFLKVSNSDFLHIHNKTINIHK